MLLDNIQDKSEYEQEIWGIIYDHVSPENQKEITEFNTIKASSIIPDAFIVICQRTYQ